MRDLRAARRIRAWAERWLEPTPQPGPDTSFAEYVGRLTLRYIQIVAILMAGAALLWWPTDRWVFRDTPEAVEVFSMTRPVVAIAGVLTVVAARLLRSRPRLAPWLLTLAASPQAFFLGWHYSQLGGLNGSWFYFTYFFPLVSILALTPPLSRLAIATLTSLAYPLAYFLRTPDYARDSRFGISISFLLFITAVAVVTGHVIYRLLERHFESQRELERRVQERTRALSRLAGHLAQSQEAERRRVARDLHDEMGQLFTAMSLELGTARAQGIPDHLRSAHDQLRGLVEEGLHAYRSLVESLRPRILDERGLEQALAWYCDQLHGRAGIEVCFEARGGSSAAPTRLQWLHFAWCKKRSPT